MESKNIIFGLLFAVLVVAACTPQGAPIDNGGLVAKEVEYNDELTNAFGSVEELNSFLSEHQSNSNMYFKGGRGLMVDAMPVMMEMAVADEGSSNDFSETNVQVAGIDEGDILKSDGEFIYTVSGNTLFVIRAFPGEDAEVVSELELESGVPQGMFLYEDKLVVFGYVDDRDVFDEFDLPIFNSLTFFEVYDISDKESLSLMKEFVFEGGCFESRMMDGHIYLVTRDSPVVRPHPVPFFLEDGLVNKVSVDSVRYFPYQYDSVSFLTINAVSLDDFAHEPLTLAVEYGNELYMSYNNIYLSTNEYVNEWEISQDITKEEVLPLLSDDDQELISRIMSVDEDILSSAEKESKVMNLVYEYLSYLDSDEREAFEEKVEELVVAKLKEVEYFQTTTINKVSVSGLDLEVVASASVPGRLNNQFSMDEHEGVLRVATTLDRHWSQFKEFNTDSENFVITLDEDLEELDMLSGIAVDESIYSTRFMGDKLYMVTFRQVDPFFVIDLSNPESIESLGELKIPGFSRYLHPFDEDHIIGLGRDATLSGRTQGLKISLFDVSDVTNPVEVAHWESTKQYSSSVAEYEHKAFLFDKDKELLVIPAYFNDWDDHEEDYNGALVFRITEEEIEVRGLIDHSGYAQYSFGGAVERSMFIEDFLYTKSFGMLRINDLDDLSSVKNVSLAKSKVDIPLF